MPDLKCDICEGRGSVTLAVRRPQSVTMDEAMEALTLPASSRAYPCPECGKSGNVLDRPDRFTIIQMNKLVDTKAMRDDLGYRDSIKRMLGSMIGNEIVAQGMYVADDYKVTPRNSFTDDTMCCMRVAVVWPEGREWNRLISVKDAIVRTPYSTGSTQGPPPDAGLPRGVTQFDAEMGAAIGRRLKRGPQAPEKPAQKPKPPGGRELIFDEETPE